MKKIKAEVGAFAVWRSEIYPYLNVSQILTVEEGADRVYATGAGQLEDFLFCVSSEDGPQVVDVVTNLRLRHYQAQTTLERTMANVLKRSILSKLDPRS